jgi:membrane fusion protein, multidrug efflux system
MKRILFIASVVFLSACAGKSTDKKAELAKLKKERSEIDAKITKLELEAGEKPAKRIAEVSVVEVAATTFNNYLEVQGKVDAEQNVQVSPQTPGTVTRVLVSIGQNVGRGQTLAQLDDQVLRQNIAQLQTQLELATTLYNRQKNLWDQKIGTEVQFLTAKTQRESLQRQIAALRTQADMYRIKAPIAGTIDQMDLRVGQSVSPGAPTGLRIVNANALKVKAQIAESYASRVNQGDNVTVIFPDAADTLRTKLSYASRLIDQASRSFNVEVRLPSKRSYRPNMMAILRIVDYTNINALTVPVNVIQKSESSDYVYIAENGIAKRANVTVGKISGGRAEILSGLKTGDQVISVGFADLNEGDAIKY